MFFFNAQMYWPNEKQAEPPVAQLTEADSDYGTQFDHESILSTPTSRASLKRKSDESKKSSAKKSMQSRIDAFFLAPSEEENTTSTPKSTPKATPGSSAFKTPTSTPTFKTPDSSTCKSCGQVGHKTAGNSACTNYKPRMPKNARKLESSPSPGEEKPNKKQKLATPNKKTPETSPDTASPYGSSSAVCKACGEVGHINARSSKCAKFGGRKRVKRLDDYW